MTFLDLPGEIWNQIYLELLPQSQIREASSSKALRHDGQKTCTRFMRSCRQVYEEAASILYYSAATEAVRVFCDESEVEFLGSTGQVGDQYGRLTNVQPLKRFAHMRIHVFLWGAVELAGAREACAVQDNLFRLLLPLRRGKTLQSLWVHIHVGEDEDAWNDFYREEGWMYMPHSSYQVMLMQEFKKIKPGDLSRPHTTAFLTDPLRTLRGIKSSDGRKGKFHLGFIGHSGKPWSELPGQVRQLVLGDEPVEDYALFHKYGEALQSLGTVFSRTNLLARKEQREGQLLLREALPKEVTDQFDKHEEALCIARVRGDVKTFIVEHHKLLSFLQVVIESRLEFSAANSSKQAQLWEQCSRELAYFCEELKHALPAADSNTSYFGYSLIDKRLQEWQTHGREEARQAKKKRKADRDAKESAAKKGKIGEEA